MVKIPHEMSLNPAFQFEVELDIAAAQAWVTEKLLRLKKLQEALTGKDLDSRLGRIGCQLVANKLADATNELQALSCLKDGDRRGLRPVIQTIYGSVTPQLQVLANTIYSQQVEKKADQSDNEGWLSPSERELLSKPLVDAWGVRDSLRMALNYHDLHYWQVVVTDKTITVNVETMSPFGPRTILVPERLNRVRRSGRNALMLLDHEIDSHVLQNVAGMTLSGAGGILEPANQSIYEGLAKQRDDEFSRLYYGEAEKLPIPHYARIISAIDAGADFVYCFAEACKMSQTLNPGQDPDKLADENFSRVARCFKGTYCSKDIGYLQGYVFQKQLEHYGLAWLSELGVWDFRSLDIMAAFFLEPGTTLEDVLLVRHDVRLPLNFLRQGGWAEYLARQEEALN